MLSPKIIKIDGYTPETSGVIGPDSLLMTGTADNINIATTTGVAKFKVEELSRKLKDFGYSHIAVFRPNVTVTKPVVKAAPAKKAPAKKAVIKKKAKK